MTTACWSSHWDHPDLVTFLKTRRSPKVSSNGCSLGRGRKREVGGKEGSARAREDDKDITPQETWVIANSEEKNISEKVKIKQLKTTCEQQWCVKHANETQQFDMWRTKRWPFFPPWSFVLPVKCSFWSFCVRCLRCSCRCIKWDRWKCGPYHGKNFYEKKISSAGIAMEAWKIIRCIITKKIYIYNTLKSIRCFHPFFIPCVSFIWHSLSVFGRLCRCTFHMPGTRSKQSGTTARLNASTPVI